MWKLLVASGALIVAANAPLRAQELPWCVEVDAFTKNCGYTSYDECATVAKNATSPATGVGRCTHNPKYQPPPVAAKSAKPAPAKSPNATAIKR